MVLRPFNKSLGYDQNKLFEGFEESRDKRTLW